MTRPYIDKETGNHIIPEQGVKHQLWIFKGDDMGEYIRDTVELIDRMMYQDSVGELIKNSDWMVVRKCFVTDHDGHWYLIDAGMRQMFMDLLEDIKDENSPKWYLWFQNFASKRCLMPTAYTFLDPKEM